MSVNKYRQHLFVLPEDDANRQLATGFLLHPSVKSVRQVHVLGEAGGWAQVRDRFASDYLDGMRQYEGRLMVLLIDFDDNLNRLDTMKEAVPEDLIDRVFVLGTLTKPEALRQASLGSYETIGMSMAGDCRSESGGIWAHALLRHNESELSRLHAAACKLLFGS